MNRIIALRSGLRIPTNVRVAEDAIKDIGICILPKALSFPDFTDCFDESTLGKRCVRERAVVAAASRRRGMSRTPVLCQRLQRKSQEVIYLHSRCRLKLVFGHFSLT
jgi:hypothetical protein